MLVGKIMEAIPAATAADNMANHLADQIRNIWLENTNAGIDRWEVNLYEDARGVEFLRRESFPGLIGLDYIFRWWGHEDPDGLAGDVEVLWKVQTDTGVKMFKTTIRFGERDFTLSLKQAESQKREQFRAEFREAFRSWKALYHQTAV